MNHADSLALLKPSPERFVILLGLLGIMLATIPGYVLLGDNERLLLMGIACTVVVIVMAVIAWRLPNKSGTRVGRLCLQLVALCCLGCIAMGTWQIAMVPRGDHILPLWAEVLPSGLTLGLMLHVLIGWWQQGRQDS